MWRSVRCPSEWTSVMRWIAFSWNPFSWRRRYRHENRGGDAWKPNPTQRAQDVALRLCSGPGASSESCWRQHDTEQNKNWRAITTCAVWHPIATPRAGNKQFWNNSSPTIVTALCTLGKRRNSVSNLLHRILRMEQKGNTTIPAFWRVECMVSSSICHPRLWETSHLVNEGHLTPQLMAV